MPVRDQVTRLRPGHFAEWLALARTGDDPELDRLLLLLLRHTAVPQQALLGLIVDALDVDSCRLRASLKNGKVQHLPVNRDLLEQVLALARERGAVHNRDAALRHRNGTPLTGRRFDALTHRLKKHAAWSRPLSIGPHAIRRLTLTEIEAQFGVVTTRAWAGHTWTGGGKGHHDLAGSGADRLRCVAETLLGPLDLPLRPAPAGDAALPRLDDGPVRPSAPLWLPAAPPPGPHPTAPDDKGRWGS